MEEKSNTPPAIIPIKYINFNTPYQSISYAIDYAEDLKLINGILGTIINGNFPYETAYHYDSSKEDGTITYDIHSHEMFFLPDYDDEEIVKSIKQLFPTKNYIHQFGLYRIEGPYSVEEHLYMGFIGIQIDQQNNGSITLFNESDHIGRIRKPGYDINGILDNSNKLKPLTVITSRPPEIRPDGQYWDK